MARNFKNKLVGQIGEHLVVAELGRRGIIATPFAGNVPDVDILAYANGISLPIQVKAQTKGDLSVDAKKYLDIQFDGDLQTIKGKSKDIERSLIFVLVQIGINIGLDDFYIYEQGIVQDLIYEGHYSFLEKHGGIRPRNPKSTHCSYFLRDLEQYKDNWNLIIGRLGR